MKTRFLALILLLIFNFGFAGENIKDIDGNEWVSFDESYKYGLVTGILLGEYIIYENLSSSINKDIKDIIGEEIFTFFNAKRNNTEENFYKGYVLLYDKMKNKLEKYCYTPFVTNLMLDDLEISLKDKILNSMKKVSNLNKKNINQINDEPLISLWHDVNLGYYLYIRFLSKVRFTYKLIGFIPDKIPTGQIKDGLDEFYKDFSNRKIKVKDAIFVVLRQINGEDEEVIKHIIRYLKTNNAIHLFIKKEGETKFIFFPP